MKIVRPTAQSPLSCTPLPISDTLFAGLIAFKMMTNEDSMPYTIDESEARRVMNVPLGRPVRAVFVAWSAALSLTACGQSQAPAPDKGAEVIQAVDGGSISQARDFASVSALALAADALVLVEPTGQSRQESADSDGRSGEMATLVQVEVLDQAKGPLKKGAEIWVRTVPGTDASPRISAQSTGEWALFLTPFTFGDKRDMGQWVSLSPHDFPQSMVSAEDRVPDRGIPESASWEELKRVAQG